MRGACTVFRADAEVVEYSLQMVRSRDDYSDVEYLQVEEYPECVEIAYVGLVLRVPLDFEPDPVSIAIDLVRRLFADIVVYGDLVFDQAFTPIAREERTVDLLGYIRLTPTTRNEIATPELESSEDF